VQPRRSVYIVTLSIPAAFAAISTQPDRQVATAARKTLAWSITGTSPTSSKSGSRQVSDDRHGSSVS